MLRQIVNFARQSTMLRGIVSYGLLWPCGSLVEQTLIEKRTYRNYDWVKCLKFSIFGGLFMGPAIYFWIRIAADMWPRTNVKSSLCKALTEQLAFDPMAITLFLYFMSLMEDKTHAQACREVSSKFAGVYRVGIIYWPVVQTFNFTFVPQRNQVVFTSFFSTLWTAFLAYMKYLQLPNVDLAHHVVDIHFLEM